MDRNDAMHGEIIARFEATSEAATKVAQAIELLMTATTDAKNGQGPGSEFDGELALVSLAEITKLVHERLLDEANDYAVKYADLVVHDILVPCARASTDPVVWLTKSELQPVMRDVDKADVVWHHGSDNEIWINFVEALLEALHRDQIAVGYREDRAYIVDMQRWERIENLKAFDPNTEWRKR